MLRRCHWLLAGKPEPIPSRLNPWAAPSRSVHPLGASGAVADDPHGASNARQRIRFAAANHVRRRRHSQRHAGHARELRRLTPVSPAWPNGRGNQPTVCSVGFFGRPVLRGCGPRRTAIRTRCSPGEDARADPPVAQRLLSATAGDATRTWRRSRRSRGYTRGLLRITSSQRSSLLQRNGGAGRPRRR